MFAVILITSIFLLFTTLAEWRFHLANEVRMPNILSQQLRLFYMFKLFSPSQIEDKQSSDVLRPKFLDTLMLVYSATCQQGSSTTPRSFSARIITMLVFTVLMFLYARLVLLVDAFYTFHLTPHLSSQLNSISYSANIVALLQSPSTKIRTLDDLLNSRLKFGVDDTVFNRYYFSV